MFRLTLTYADGRQVTSPLPAVDSSDAVNLCGLMFESEIDIVGLTLRDPDGAVLHQRQR